MRVAIIVDDNIVVVDGKWRTVDTSPLIAEGLHAVQWYDSFGEEEYRNEIDPERKAWTRKPNEVINDLAPYQAYVDAWQVENAKQTLIEEAQRRQIEEDQAKAKAAQERIEAFLKLTPEEQQKAIEDDLRNR